MAAEQPTAEQLNTQLDALEALTNTDFAALLVQHDQLREMESRANKMKDDVASKIKAKMEAEGLKTVHGGGRRATLAERFNYGFDRGETEEDAKRRLAEIQEFFSKYAPELNVPATTNIKKALDSYFAATGQQELPAFIKETKVVSLTNAKVAEK